MKPAINTFPATPASTYVCEADVLLGATFMGEKLLLFGQGFDSIEARRESALMPGYVKPKGLFTYV